VDADAQRCVRTVREDCSDELLNEACHPDGVFAGLCALRAGGTVADALVAVTVLDTVVLPGTSTLAGQLVTVLHEAAMGEAHALNAGFDAVLGDSAPFDYRTERATGRAVVVPGIVAGLEALWRRFGALPWADLWRPAIHFARAGFPLTPVYYGNLLRRRAVVLRHPEGRAIFAPHGRLLRPGDILRQPALAATLEGLAAGGAAAYTGRWAAELVATVQRAGGALGAEGLARYAPRWVPPLCGDYLGHGVRTLPAPAVGGPLLLLGLRAAA
jgi:gamma-glutamyltranspeptidase / glutathione hydrolase